MTGWTATAPGKVMLAGEYAVLDGGLAVVTAVDRRAIATVATHDAGDLPPPSEFLRAARAVVAEAHGPQAAAGFDRLRVDTDALREGDRKLGLGSSAAATVAAIAAVLADAGVIGDEPPMATIVGLALAAHARAQGERGARGSGADVVASAHGGVLGVRRDGDGHVVRSIALPADLVLGFAWTGQPADTATLVAAVRAARARDPGPIAQVLHAIDAHAQALATATDAGAAITAIALGGQAMTELAARTGVALVPAAVAALAHRLAPLGGAAKTTGAGGGDIVLIATPAAVDRNQVAAAIIQAGLWPIPLALAPTGVDILPTPA